MSSNISNFSRPSYTGETVSGEVLDRLLTLSDLCESAWDGKVASVVRLAVRMYRNQRLPDHVAEALDDIEESALIMINSQR
jgi:hypothetical protein